MLYFKTKSSFVEINVIFSVIMILVYLSVMFSNSEKAIVDDLIKTGIIAFYRRYVDDTLVLIKPKDIPFVLNKFNSFDKNL